MNQMLKIAICDDEQPIRDYLKKLTQACTDADVYVFPDGETLLSDQTDYDVILLDISLDQEHGTDTFNGMDVARKIRERSDAIIIFVTALKEYVFEGYDVGAFHYLLKPIDEQTFIVDYRLQLYNQEEGALDVARAVRFVRKNAHVYGIEPDDIAVMGFSAGGIQAGEFLMHYDEMVNGTLWTKIICQTN